MLKHIKNEHENDGDNVNFKWKVTKVSRKPLERQITEAVKISRKSDIESLNSKSEFNHHSIKRITLANQGKVLNCDVCGKQFVDICEMEDHVNQFHDKVDCIECDKIFFGRKALQYHLKSEHKIQ